jgi:integrating conjugative element protein (TIGR03765 family)
MNFILKTLLKCKVIAEILIVLICIILPPSSFAELTVIKDSGGTIPVESYLSDVKVPDQSTQTALLQMLKRNAEKLKNISNSNTIKFNKLLFPAKSNFTVGDVKKHRLQEEQAKRLQSLTFYVVGDDERSIKWLKTNAEYFKKIGALGFLTNVDSRDRVVAIEHDTGMNLMIVSLDDLASIVGTSNYPFLVYKGWVLQ